VDSHVGRMIEGRYAVLGVLGRGAVTVVYLARHIDLGSLHAIKVLDGGAPALQVRLQREGRAQSSLRHPNLVPVTDLVRIEGAIGLVMEYVAGPSLARVLAEGPLSLAEADGLARGILAGVEAAHARDLVHGGLKPEDILLDPSGDQVAPRVGDFGIATLLRGDAEVAAARSYLAPEQLNDPTAGDARSDVFALGAILYELLTGRRAFVGDDAAGVAESVRHVRYAPVRELRPGVPTRMVVAVEAALVADPAERLTAAELLGTWSAGLPAPAIGERVIALARLLDPSDDAKPVVERWPPDASAVAPPNGPAPPVHPLEGFGHTPTPLGWDEPVESVEDVVVRFGRGAPPADAGDKRIADVMGDAPTAPLQALPPLVPQPSAPWGPGWLVSGALAVVGMVALALAAAFAAGAFDR
jgi:serine/threonine protein kinase